MAQYDTIAKQYNVYSEEHSWCAKIFTPSIARMLGDVKSKDVLDIACGDGTQTRKMKQWEANRVTGVDISLGLCFCVFMCN